MYTHLRISKTLVPEGFQKMYVGVWTVSPTGQVRPPTGQVRTPTPIYGIDLYPPPIRDKSVPQETPQEWCVLEIQKESRDSVSYI